MNKFETIPLPVVSLVGKNQKGELSPLRVVVNSKNTTKIYHLA